MASVLIVSKHSLFGQGVERLLQRQNDLVVLAVESDFSTALERTAELRPDILILDSSDPNCDPAPVLSQLLHRNERAAIVGLNLSDNVACVCSMEHHLVSDVSDLLHLMRPAVSAVMENRS